MPGEVHPALEPNVPPQDAHRGEAVQVPQVRVQRPSECPPQDAPTQSWQRPTFQVIPPL